MTPINEVEIEELRKKLEAEKKRRVSAEDALHFYANPANYNPQKPYEGITYQNLLIADFEDAANSKNTKIAGAKARLHFKVFSEL